MSELDGQTLALLKKAVEGEITESVLKKIRNDIYGIRFLGLLGIILIALAATFHKPIFEFIVKYGGDGFHDTIKKSIKEQSDQGEKIKLSFETTGESAKAEYGKLRELLITTRTDIEDEKIKLQGILKSLKEAEQSAREARDVNIQRVAAAQTDVDAVGKRLDETLVQVKALIENQKLIVDALTQKPDKIAEVKVPPVEGKKVTVYLQFAGFNRADAEAISASIKSKGWSIPGEERTTAAINTNEIRFNPSDREVANSLKRDADEALKSYRIELKLTPNSLIKPGIPEIWIYRS